MKFKVWKSTVWNQKVRKCKISKESKVWKLKCLLLSAFPHQPNNPCRRWYIAPGFIKVRQRASVCHTNFHTRLSVYRVCDSTYKKFFEETHLKSHSGWGRVLSSIALCLQSVWQCNIDIYVEQMQPLWLWGSLYTKFFEETHLKNHCDCDAVSKANFHKTLSAECVRTVQDWSHSITPTKTISYISNKQTWL